MYAINDMMGKNWTVSLHVYVIVFLLKASHLPQQWEGIFVFIHFNRRPHFQQGLWSSLVSPRAYKRHTGTENNIKDETRSMLLSNNHCHWPTSDGGHYTWIHPDFEIKKEKVLFHRQAYFTRQRLFTPRQDLSHSSCRTGNHCDRN